MLNVISVETRIVSGFFLVLFSGSLGQLDVDLGVFFLTVSLSFERFRVVLDDVSLLESDDHGQTGDSVVHGVGDFQAVVEAVQGAAQVKILVSLLTEKSVTQNTKSNRLVSSFRVGFVDFDFLFQFDSVLDFWSVLQV